MNVTPMGRNITLITPAKFSINHATTALNNVFSEELVCSLTLPELGVVLYKIKVGDACLCGHFKFQAPNNNQTYLCETIQKNLGFLSKEAANADSYEISCAIAGILPNKSYILMTFTQEKSCIRCFTTGPSVGTGIKRFDFLSQHLCEMFAINLGENFEPIC